MPSNPISILRDRLAILARHHMNGLGSHLVSGPLYHAGPHAAVGLLLTGNPVTSSTFCRKAIAVYKVPKRLVVVSEVPRSAMGKVDKAAPRQVFADLAEAGD